MTNFRIKGDEDVLEFELKYEGASFISLYLGGVEILTFHIEEGAFYREEIGPHNFNKLVNAGVLVYDDDRKIVVK